MCGASDHLLRELGSNRDSVRDMILIHLKNKPVKIVEVENAG
jgi:hypothetical protein